VSHEVPREMCEAVERERDRYREALERLEEQTDPAHLWCIRIARSALHPETE